jgi:RNA polymerase sigma-70 factor (ECF subfamily)
VGDDENSGEDITDEATFARRFEAHRRELHVHCYRMLASYDEAEDLVQETFLRAWRTRHTFEGTYFRAWLYRIATNACLDVKRRDARRPQQVRSFAELPWLQPYPDALLDEVATDDEPDAVVVARETIELAVMAALQVLPPRQRAVLIARDLLGWSAADTAELLDMSVPAANSALQRARVTMQGALPERRLEWGAGIDAPSGDEQGLLDRLIDAHERHDATAAAQLLRHDIRITMPPLPMVYDGIDVVRPFLEHAFGPGEVGDWRLVPTRANRMPAVGCYLRAWDDDTFRAFKLDVIRIVDGAVAEFTTFGSSLFPAFGLPPVLEEG